MTSTLRAVLTGNNKWTMDMLLPFDCHPASHIKKPRKKISHFMAWRVPCTSNVILVFLFPCTKIDEKSGAISQH